METQVLENLLREISKKLGDISYHLNKTQKVKVVGEISGQKIRLSETTNSERSAGKIKYEDDCVWVFDESICDWVKVASSTEEYADKDATATSIKELEARIEALEQGLVKNDIQEAKDIMFTMSTRELERISKDKDAPLKIALLAKEMLSKRNDN